jgi:hypothetical protein
MNNSNTQTQRLFSAIAKSNLREPKNLLTPDIKLKPQSLVFNYPIINIKLIGVQNLNDLIDKPTASQEVKDFHLGLLLVINILSGATQLLDPEEDDGEEDEDFDEDDDSEEEDEDFDEDDDYEDGEEEVVKVVLKRK